MDYKAADFLNLRKQIVSNAILNKLMVATLSGTQEPINVGKALIRLNGKLRGAVCESKGPKGKIPSYVMVDIMVSLASSPAIISHKYKDYPEIVQHHSVAANLSCGAYLKNLTTAIMNSYDVNPAKADKIFSSLPESVSILLESSRISTNYWKTGFPKALKKVSRDDVILEELDEYYEALCSRLQAWRAFNSILISLVNKRHFVFEKPTIGKVVADIMSKSEVLLFSKDYVTHEFQSHIVKYSTLSPIHWHSTYDPEPQLVRILRHR